MVHKKILSQLKTRGVAGRQIFLGQFNTISEFVRNNPVLTGLIGSGVLATLGTAGVAIIRRRKRSKTKARRRPARRKSIRRRKTSIMRRRKHRKGVTHRSPRHRGHKKVTFTTKQGKRVSFLVKKRKRR